MPSHLDTALAAAIERAAAEAGLAVLSSEQGEDFHRRPTARFRLAASAGSEPERSFRLELSESFDWRSGKLLAEIASYLREQARRLRNPMPDASVTLAGLPIVFDNFRWPFHRSVSGADTYIVHGAVLLAGGTHSPLHAKVSASMTLTFAEIVAAPEQPFAESFVYNAVRKMLDQGQLEMLKSGIKMGWHRSAFFLGDSDRFQRDCAAAPLVPRPPSDSAGWRTGSWGRTDSPPRPAPRFPDGCKSDSGKIDSGAILIRRSRRQAG